MLIWLLSEEWQLQGVAILLFTLVKFLEWKFPLLKFFPERFELFVFEAGEGNGLADAFFELGVFCQHFDGVLGLERRKVFVVSSAENVNTFVEGDGEEFLVVVDAEGEGSVASYWLDEEEKSVPGLGNVHGLV